ncbi:ABC transporter substrate-binding protein [Cypionkella sp.]|uniref:ABC transporter substrate-binding protein n=1 Tax=Cypionkella sp. TaxID=2811411 RepID=UPI0027210AF5|nr:ABC transporter substrate-binding protein [Cypionkella sp.]MDO8984123.1 ABC transporter substrate-binding protein [Cypionkella sp.]MDP2047797.1 ABC transporter substrate-binding protein [Cypionkella sp.]
MSFGFKSRALRSAGVAALISALGTPMMAEEIFYVSGSVGKAVENFKTLVKPWEEATGNTVTLVPMPASTSDQFGQYRLWLAAGATDIDVYQTDVIWAPQLADHFVDLSDVAKDLAPTHFPSIIESQTVNGKLVALPIFTDAPALYYRKDLLEKYGVAVPKTWDELTAAATKIQEGERAAGKADFWGYVWQGNAYEGLTCDALEWVKSHGGGQIVEADGTISINNEKAVKALETAAAWVGTISPEGVLAYGEEESRGVWQTGNAAFMRNWPYAYTLGNGDDSAVKGLFDVTTLPVGAEGDTSAATLGGWNAAVSKYSKHQDVAISLVMYLAGPEAQKARAISESALPTIVALYDDADIGAAQPIIPQWKNVFLNAVPRPSAPTLGKYNEVSSKFWSAVHETLSGNGSAADNLAGLEADLTDLKGDAW